MFFAVVAPSDILGFLSSQTEITRNCELTLAYENEIKPTPMKKAIVALGVEKMTVGDYLTETAADGAVTVTSNRQADLVLKISIFAPYSYGSYETHKILDRIVTAMLYSQKLYTVTSCESGGVHYVRDTGALVLDTYFTEPYFMSPLSLRSSSISVPLTFFITILRSSFSLKESLISVMGFLSIA